MRHIQGFLGSYGAKTFEVDVDALGCDLEVWNFTPHVQLNGLIFRSPGGGNMNSKWTDREVQGLVEKPFVMHCNRIRHILIFEFSLYFGPMLVRFELRRPFPSPHLVKWAFGLDIQFGSEDMEIKPKNNNGS